MIIKAFKTTMKRIVVTSFATLLAINLIFYIRSPEIFLNWWLIPVQFLIPLSLALILTPIEYFKLSNYSVTKAK